jgi:hypothetical protein
MKKRKLVSDTELRQCKEMADACAELASYLEGLDLDSFDERRAKILCKLKELATNATLQWNEAAGAGRLANEEVEGL